jgi:hypothetical protein
LFDSVGTFLRPEVGVRVGVGIAVDEMTKAEIVCNVVSFKNKPNY